MTEYSLASRTGVRTVLLAAVAVALAACASSSGEWIKTEAVTVDSMDTDLQDCELFGQAAGLSAANQPDNTYVGGITSTGQVTTNQIPEAGTSGYAAQSDAFASCMEARGYMLATAP